MNLKDLIYRFQTLIFKNPKLPDMFLLYCGIPVFYDNKNCYFYFLDLKYNNFRRIKIPKILTFSGFKRIKTRSIDSKNLHNNILKYYYNLDITEIDNLIEYFYETYPKHKGESCDCCKVVDKLSTARYFYNNGKLSQNYGIDNYTFKEIYEMIKNVELLRNITIQNINIIYKTNPELLI